MAASQTIRTLKLSLLADTSGFNKPLQNAQGSFDKFQGALSKAAVPATAALGAITAAAGSAISAASDLEQTFSAVEQVFGERAARRLDEFARGAAESLGQSRQEALGAAQQFGILGTAAGLEGDQLADFAITLSTLASDLAAFSNTTPQEAIDALGSALRGEFNPIERFGIVLNAAAVNSIALAEGLAETAAEITTEDQVYARFLGLIQESGIQQGQFARETESLGAQSAIAKAKLEDFRAEVGEQLLPVFVEFVPLLQDMVTAFVNTDPETIIRIGEGIAVLAAAVVTLNAALKVFAGLKATAALLGIGTGAAAAAATAALGGVVAASAYGALRPSAQADIERRRITGDARFGFASGQYGGPGDFTISNARSRASAGLGPTTITNVQVGGFVGNERELARAIQRAQEEARRTGGLTTPGVFR